MAELGDTVKAWVKRFWWLRGAAAAMAVAATVPTYVNMDRFEFLRAFHAIIVGWNEVMGVIGQLIGQIPFVPNIPALTVSALIFSLSTATPLSAVFIRSGYSNQNPFYVKIANFVLSPLVIVLVFLIYQLLIMFSKPVYFEGSDRPIIILFSLFFLFIILTIWLVSIFYNSSYRRGVVYIVGFVITIEIFYLLNIGGGFINSWACGVLEIPAEEC